MCHPSQPTESSHANGRHSITQCFQPSGRKPLGQVVRVRSRMCDHRWVGCKWTQYAAVTGIPCTAGFAEPVNGTPTLAGCRGERR